MIEREPNEDKRIEIVPITFGFHSIPTIQVLPRLLLNGTTHSNSLYYYFNPDFRMAKYRNHGTERQEESALATKKGNGEERRFSSLKIYAMQFRSNENQTMMINESRYFQQILVSTSFKSNLEWNQTFEFSILLFQSRFSNSPAVRDASGRSCDPRGHGNRQATKYRNRGTEEWRKERRFSSSKNSAMRFRWNENQTRINESRYFQQLLVSTPFQ